MGKERERERGRERESLQASAKFGKTWRRHVMDINIVYGGGGLLAVSFEVVTIFLPSPVYLKLHCIAL